MSTKEQRQEQLKIFNWKLTMVKEEILTITHNLRNYALIMNLAT